MTSVNAYRFNTTDNTFKPEPVDLPKVTKMEGDKEKKVDGDLQDIMAAAGARHRGSVTWNTVSIDTYSFHAGEGDSAAINGAAAAGIIHWGDGSQSLVVMDSDIAISRLQNEAGRLVFTEGGLGLSFDGERKPVAASSKQASELPPTVLDTTPKVG